MLGAESVRRAPIEATGITGESAVSRAFMLAVSMLVLWSGMVPLAAQTPVREPIRIGVSGPFTGGSAPMGLSMRSGIRLATESINAQGGIGGRNILLVERDDEARPERGLAIANGFVRSERVVAVVGVVNTGVALASQRVYQDARIPVLTAVATGSLVTQQFKSPQEADNYVFRAAANDTIQAEMIVEEAVTRLHARRVAILADSTNYGQLGREDLQRALERKGVRAAVVERFNVGDVDLSAQVGRARGAAVEAVLTYGIGPELAQIANEMARQNWRVPLIGSWTLAMANFIDRAGPNAEGARMPQTFIAEPTNPRHAAFLEAYRKSGAGERIPIPPAAAQGYDAMLLLAAALRQAGSTDGPRLREALENLRLPVEGVIARYERPYSRTDHEAIDNPQSAVIGEVRNGRVVFAYDEDRKRLARR